MSKTMDAEAVRAAFAAGERDFGENQVQEATEKIVTLDDVRNEITWHLIGPLQSNKTRVVAEQFDWVHSIDRVHTAERLSRQRPEHLTPLQVCVQVNVSGEATKSGVAPGELAALAHAVAALPRLRLRGLMAIPEPADDIEAQRRPLRAVREMFDGLKRDGLAIDTLSMGMSGDLEAAVLEGSTIVRIGSSIFGARAVAR